MHAPNQAKRKSNDMLTRSLPGGGPMSVHLAQRDSFQWIVCKVSWVTALCCYPLVTFPVITIIWEGNILPLTPLSTQIIHSNSVEFDKILWNLSQTPQIFINRRHKFKHILWSVSSIHGAERIEMTNTLLRRVEFGIWLSNTTETFCLP